MQLKILLFAEGSILFNWYKFCRNLKAISVCNYFKDLFSNIIKSKIP